MNSRRMCGFAIAGAAAGALVGGVLLASPAAHADDVPMLPIPPYDPNTTGLGPPGEPGDWTNIKEFTIPFIYDNYQYDQAFTSADGSLEVHYDRNTFGWVLDPLFQTGTEQVTASEGAAPAVGTEWSGETFLIPSWGFEYTIFENSSVTTPAGTADIFIPENIPFLEGWVNEFYNGPAGIFDYVVSVNGGATAIPIIDMPAETSPGAAADFGTLWSELLGTL